MSYRNGIKRKHPFDLERAEPMEPAGDRPDVSILCAIYILAAAAANLVVAWLGPMALIFNAAVLIGLDITTRDALHERWKGPALWPRMLGLILAASALTALLNADAARIAAASFSAFLLAGIADTAVYQFLITQERRVRINGSNIAAAAVDSGIFLFIAFGAIDVLVFAVTFAAKVVGGFFWSLIIHVDN